MVSCKARNNSPGTLNRALLATAKVYDTDECNSQATTVAEEAVDNDDIIRSMLLKY
jgi:hypothetical protein